LGVRAYRLATCPTAAGWRSTNERWDLLNEPRNFFKHPGKDLTDQILFSDEMNDYLLLVASNDCLCAPVAARR
jgi:hypothetical protein